MGELSFVNNDQWRNITYEASPEVVDVIVMGKAAFHNVETESVAGRDGGETLARWARPHTLHRGETTWGRLNLGRR